MTELKLGKRPFKPDPRDIKMKTVVAGITLPTPPTRFGHGGMFRDWLMLGNGPDDTVRKGFQGAGNCVFAGLGHQLKLAERLGGHDITITGKDAISDYSAVTGYVIGDDATDNGTEPRDALKHAQKTGILAGGKRYKIGAYALVDPKSWDDLMIAAFAFSSVGIGFEFPDTAMGQFVNGETWDVVDGAIIEGGHYVPTVGRSSRNIGGDLSWARRVGMTRDFYETYNDETWAIIWPQELRNGKTERGMDLTQLKAVLAAL